MRRRQKRFFRIFRCISEDICTDEVIITDNQVKHIKERHPSVYEAFNLCLEEMINFPDYKNSIITFMKIDDKEWKRLLRNKKVLLPLAVKNKRFSLR